jgi:hypothetical protein
MAPDLDDAIAALSTRLAGRVHLPGSPCYRASLSRLFVPEAAHRRPPCVILPRSADDVAAVMRLAQHGGVRVSVRGGGLSANCVAYDAALVDLSVHLGTAERDGTRLRAGGGATVATILDSLAPVGRVVPVGVAGAAGFGLVTGGGIGYLTRSAGLTLDHLDEIELVLPSGEAVHLSETSRGRDAELWWAVRGCAAPFGVVTSAVLRTFQQGPVHVDRLVTGLDALATYFSQAPGLPRQISMSAVLGYRPESPGPPVLFVYTACASGRAEDIERAGAATSAVAAGSSRPALFRRQTRGRYLSGLPQLAIPDGDGDELVPPAIPPRGIGQFDSRSVFLTPPIGPGVATDLAELIASAPTTSCRIDFQHTGGALADVSDAATAFKGRTAEWNMALNAVWSDPEDAEPSRGWITDTLGAVRSQTIGVYGVDIRPGRPDTDTDVHGAFGTGLPRLRALRDQVDPVGILAGHPL